MASKNSLFYNIHRKILVEIDSTASHFASGYDIYLRHFRSTDPAASFTYKVFDYSCFKLPSEYLVSPGNGLVGFSNGFALPQESYALILNLEKGSIEEYTTYPNRSTIMLLEILLARAGLSFVHAAGATLGSKSFLFPAFPGIGKTALISKLRNFPNSKIFGDDLVVVEKTGQLLSFPTDLAVYPYHLKSFPELKNGRFHVYLISRKIFGLYFFLKKVINFISKRFFLKRPIFHTNLDTCARIPFSVLIDSAHTGDSAALSAVAFIERANVSEIQFEKFSPKEIANRSLGILANEYEISLKHANALASFGALDLKELLKAQADILAEAFSKAETFRIILPEIVDTHEAADTIIKWMTKQSGQY